METSRATQRDDLARSFMDSVAARVVLALGLVQQALGARTRMVALDVPILRAPRVGDVMAFLTYKEIVAALRRVASVSVTACPDHIEESARRIVKNQTPYYHVVIRDEDGAFLDPTTTPPSREPIKCECADYTMVGYSREAYDPSWYGGSSDLYGHHPVCPKYEPPR